MSSWLRHSTGPSMTEKRSPRDSRFQRISGLWGHIFPDRLSMRLTQPSNFQASGISRASRWQFHRFVERLRRSVKYQEAYWNMIAGGWTGGAVARHFSHERHSKRPRTGLVPDRH